MAEMCLITVAFMARLSCKPMKRMKIKHTHIHVHLGHEIPDDAVLQQLKLLELHMSKLQQAIDAAIAQQDNVTAAVNTITQLVDDVRQLLNANDVTGAQELLDKIDANKDLLVSAVNAGTEMDHLADKALLENFAANGPAEPVAVDASLVEGPIAA